MTLTSGSSVVGVELSSDCPRSLQGLWIAWRQAFDTSAAPTWACTCFSLFMQWQNLLGRACACFGVCVPRGVPVLWCNIYVLFQIQRAASAAMFWPCFVLKEVRSCLCAPGYGEHILRGLCLSYGKSWHCLICSSFVAPDTRMICVHEQVCKWRYACGRTTIRHLCMHLCGHGASLNLPWTKGP